MKRFDKGYIFSSLLSDFFVSTMLIFIIFKDFLLDEDTKTEDILATLPYIAIGFVVIYICFTIYRILYYRTSGYQLTETEIKCNRGVLFRKRSVLDYKKVHAINKRQSLFHRIFGIAVLTIDSGSTNTAHQAEIMIIEKDKTVDSLLNELNALKENGTREGVAASKEEVLLSENDSLYRFTSARKMLYTLINIVSTAVATALFGVVTITVLGICKLMVQQDFLGTWGQYFLHAFFITFLAMLVLSFFTFLAGVVYSFVGYYDFTVSKRGNDIQISYGLFEKHTNTFSYNRIKAVKISQSLVQRILGFAAIRLEVIGYTEDGGNDNNAGIGVLVPFCKYDEVGEILGKILPDYIPEEKQTKAVSYFPFVSWFILILAIVTGVVLVQSLGSMMIFHAPSYAIAAVALSVAGAALIVLMIKLVSAIFSYHNNGLALGNGKITAYCGGFTRNITVFMVRNLVAVEDVTTPLRKKAGITSLSIHLKTNALTNVIKVHIQNNELPEELEKQLIV